MADYGDSQHAAGPGRTRAAVRLHCFVDRVSTPIGDLVVVADEDGCLRAVDFGDDRSRLERTLQLCHRAAQIALEERRDPAGLTTALGAYFGGELGAIDTLRVRTGGTSFQQRVWDELRRIPCGTTVSYSELARRIGRPAAVRAVGLANGSNPVPIVVPCHRVIGANGTLTGYGGGLDRKAWLLRHEHAVPAPQLF